MTNTICLYHASLQKPFQRKLPYLVKSRHEKTAANNCLLLETTARDSDPSHLKWLDVDPAFTKIQPIHKEKET